MSHFGIFFAPVPELFWSAYSGEPFFKCIDCEVPLAESNVYVVQKRFVGGEAVFEMAMCERCRERMTQEYSEETKQNITEYMSTQFLRRAEDGLEDTEEPQVIEVSEIEDPEDGLALLNRCIEECLICGTERKDCHRYSLAGLCRLDEIVAQITPLSRTPLMVCEKCERGMADLVSQQTRDSWDRFVEEHFDGPPGVEQDSPANYPMAF
ncbi:hypothetical protein [Fuerstiella marisgermanici]|uniref:Uncharacterized protein n=1 Tax=Fuerstiella marisgermanici TaxID=1891926 RepID=A0A1P8WIN6_9PLAN|nr:hypothetical protein [Fuerstiella marisgermanici]APZ93914.1 hypothetical protein Fuma_03532 [Fuerstiella marisgermanici]